MKMNFMKKMLTMSVTPCLVVCILLCGGSAISLEKNMTMEIEETLRTAAYSLAYDDTQEVLDGYKHDLDVDVTIFTDDIRERTTVVGSVGTAADPTIYTKVRSGEEYFSTNANVNGQEYFGYYIPIYDESNEFIGMSFAGKPTEEAQGVITKSIMSMVGSALAILLIVVVIVVLLAKRMTDLMKNSTDLISEVSMGNFAVEANQKTSNDEIGDIYKQAGDLAKSLRTTIMDIRNVAYHLKDMSDEMSESTDTVSNNTGEINKAIEEIASGAMDQAESTQHASESMVHVNEAIFTIQDQIKELDNVASNMQKLEEDVLTYISALKDINEKTNVELKDVEEKVNKTSEAINNIQKATKIIKDIAGQTKLLALNASIEASHAGEAGKGFAVVATEVSTLAFESNAASGDIEEILKTLLESYGDVTASVERLVDNMDKQSVGINDTYDKIVVLDGDIGEVVKSVNVIGESCVEAKSLSENVVDAFSSLSAISEENAAGCEETNASVQELNAIIANVSNQAAELSEISNNLVNEVGIFRV